MADDVQDRVIAAIAKTKNIAADRIRLDSTFEELGVDSLDAIELLFELEDVYQVAIPDNDAKSFETVGEVVEALRRVLDPDPGGEEPHAS